MAESTFLVGAATAAGRSNFIPTENGSEYA